MNSFASVTAAPTLNSAGLAPSGASLAPIEDLGRVFNTALLSSRSQSSRDWMGEIERLMETPAFRSLMSSIRHLARTQGTTEAAAAEEMIRTIRALDSAWSDYVFQEGLERIRGN
jgi:hypothetical protein